MASLQPVFAVPLPDAPFNLLEAIDHHKANNPEYPLFRYEDADSNIRIINWGQAAQAFNEAAQFTLQCAPLETPSTDNALPKVIGILVNLDTVTYYSLIIGIMKAGYTPFLISIRNSAGAIAHLMAETKCDILFATEDPTTHQLAVSACNLLEKGGLAKTSTKMFLAPTFDRLYTKVTSSPDKQLSQRKISDQTITPCVIIHSSGTVSFPKPNTLTYSMILQHATIHRYERDLIGRILSAHALPLYHLMGFTMIPWSTVLGMTLAVFRPTGPVIIPSPDLVLRSAVATSSSLIFCASSFLENWAVDPSNIESMKTFDKVMFGGGPLQINIGDSLLNHGVNLVPLLGLTETGIFTTFSTKPKQSESWSWYEADARIDVAFVPEDKENGIFRLVVKENAFKTPAIFNTAIDGIRAFDTKDLVTMHPTNPRLWQIYGRADDQIMHSNGVSSEKTNPIPIEAVLLKSPLISAAIMFGRARFQPGVLIMPHPDYAFDLIDHKRLRDYVELIWDVVVSANRHSPQHSRIFKEMILIADPQRPFEYTVKGTLRRQATLEKYEQDIEQLYEVVETDTTGNFQMPHSRDPADITSFIRSIVCSVLEQNAKDLDDIFRVGADSLCALSIRNAVISGLRQSGILSSAAVHALPRDFVYSLSSISSMSAFIAGAVLIDGLRIKDQPSTGAPQSEVRQVAPEPEKKSDMVIDPIDPDLRWQTILESKETVVEIAPGRGEPPFIILHGGPGTVETFPSFMTYTSAVWGIQVVDDAPRDSIEAVAAFYYAKIKEKQPYGPYRLASYSGSCVIVMELVSLVERSGESVSQFAMLDLFPTLFFPNIRADDVHVDSAEWMNQYVRERMEGVLRLLIPAMSNPLVQQRYQELKGELDGLPGTPGSRRFVRRVTDMHTMALGYMMKEEFFTLDQLGRKSWSPELFKKFTTSIKAPLTMYVAKEGAKIMMPSELEDQRDDLGARAFFPNAQIVSVEGDHMTCLFDEEMRRSIEGEYGV